MPSSNRKSYFSTNSSNRNLLQVSSMSCCLTLDIYCILWPHNKFLFSSNNLKILVSTRYHPIYFRNSLKKYLPKPPILFIVTLICSTKKDWIFSKTTCKWVKNKSCNWLSINLFSWLVQPKDWENQLFSSFNTREKFLQEEKPLIYLIL